MTMVSLALALTIGLVGCKSSEELNTEGSRLVDLRRDYGAGKELFLEAIEADENNYKAHKNLAFVLTKEGRVDDAIFHLGRAVAIKPDYANAHINLSLLHAQRKEWDKAIEHMDAAIENGFPVDLKYRDFLQKHR
jgi:tetratricopeptide (TPR) repeat protein